MRNEYIENKAPKDKTLYQKITRTISLDKKNSGLEYEDIANEIGLNAGTLKNKLKPSMITHDLNLSEYIHLLELTGDYSSLDYIASKLDMVLIPKKQANTNINDLNLLVDVASIENNDVFRTVKLAMADNKITESEKESILKEIDEAQKANAILKDRVLHTAIKDNT